MADAASKDLMRIIAAATPRQKAEPTGTMRERIAVALRGSRPNHFRWAPSMAYDFYLLDKPEMRAHFEAWADRLLAHFDVLGLELVDTQADKN